MVTTISQKPGLQAYEDSIRLPFDELAARLRDILGARLVAYIARLNSTRPVKEWIEDGRKPGGETVDRLRKTYHIAALLREVEGQATVQSWFKGMNPQLDYQPPARILRDESLDEAGPEVLAAALSFAFVG
jgi:hypothetical protein